nr:hypothetical protein [Tanacetum cinerariifolium]
TPEGNEDKGSDEEDQELRLSEEARIQEEEEEADELYHSHVTLTPVHPDGLQKSSSVSSFVTSMLNPISDAGVESIFTTASSPIVSLQTQTPIMIPSTIATITTSSDAPTIPSTILKNLPTFNSVFCFDERLRTSYAIAADLSEMELKKILIKKMEGNKSIQHSDEQRNLYKALVEAYDADKTILDTYGESTILKRRRKDDDQEGPFAGSDRGSKRQREGGEHASASTPLKQLPGTTCQMEEPSHLVFEAGADDQPIVQTSQHPEWFSQLRRPPLPDHDWNKT